MKRRYIQPFPGMANRQSTTIEISPQLKEVRHRCRLKRFNIPRNPRSVFWNEGSIATGWVPVNTQKRKRDAQLDLVRSLQKLVRVSIPRTNSQPIVAWPLARLQRAAFGNQQRSPCRACARETCQGSLRAVRSGSSNKSILCAPGSRMTRRVTRDIEFVRKTPLKP